MDHRCGASCTYDSAWSRKWTVAVRPRPLTTPPRVVSESRCGDSATSDSAGRPLFSPPPSGVVRKPTSPAYGSRGSRRGPPLVPEPQAACAPRRGTAAGTFGPTTIPRGARKLLSGAPRLFTTVQGVVGSQAQLTYDSQGNRKCSVAAPLRSLKMAHRGGLAIYESLRSRSWVGAVGPRLDSR